MQQQQPCWSVVRASGTRALEAHPLVRAKAIRAYEDVLARALVGYLSSWAAVRRQNNPVGKHERLNLGAHMRMLADVVMRLKVTDADFIERVKRKQAKLMRQRWKFQKANRARTEKSVP